MELPKFDPVTKIWQGAITPYPFGQKGVAQICYENMKANLQHVCQINDDSDETYTYERALKAAVSLAHNLKYKYGVRESDRILLFMDHHHYMLPTWLGCALVGAILCPFTFTEESVKEEIADLVSQINPAIFITSENLNLELFEAVFTHLKLNIPTLTYNNNIITNDDLKPLLECDINIDDFALPKIEDPGKDTFILALSSSTTGKSKLIIITHKQMLLFMVDGLSKIRISSTMRPGWHSIAILLFWTLTSNLTVVVRAKWTIDQFLLMIAKHKINAIFTKPKDIFVAIKSPIIEKVSLDALKLVASTGEHMSAKVGEQIQKYVKNGIVQSLYGVSDVGGAITSIAYGKCPEGSVGKVGRNVQMKIIGENGKNLYPNEIGEIYVKYIYANFSGYYQNEKLTKECVDADGYFKTGDIGYVDESGNLFLVERKKYLISYRGEWINQSVIEKAVLDNVPGCDSVCAVDVEDEINGVIPIIAIIPEKGASLDEQEILKVARASHDFSFETKVMFFDKLPMTISSKFRKHLVRDLILKRLK